MSLPAATYKLVAGRMAVYRGVKYLRSLNVDKFQILIVLEGLKLRQMCPFSQH